MHLNVWFSLNASVLLRSQPPAIWIYRIKCNGRSEQKEVEMRRREREREREWKDGREEGKGRKRSEGKWGGVVYSSALRWLVKRRRLWVVVVVVVFQSNGLRFNGVSMLVTSLCRVTEENSRHMTSTTHTTEYGFLPWRGWKFRISNLDVVRHCQSCFGSGLPSVGLLWSNRVKSLTINMPPAGAVSSVKAISPR